ncbi:tetratricopeptide repeat protein [Chitinilyticum aquatile]|uniref:tetratricopeptide repeat protein n=1 Tax=Chitinilyticum aquatile TaxID=362520 RepID=UPI00049076E4|nr:tetratricopeptide repeat protein [Chitinilyticum aquatile]
MSNSAELDRLLARTRKLIRTQCAEALAQALHAESLASQSGNVAQHARALCCLAHAHHILGNSRQSLVTLQKLTQLGEQHDLGQTEGDGLQITARVHYTLGNYPFAREYWQRCLTMPDAAIRLEDRVLAHIGLGQLYFAHEHFRAALAHHEEAEELAASSDDYHLQSGIMINIGADLIQLGRLDDAVKILKEALPLVRADQNYEYEAEIYSHLGNIQLLQGEHDKARMTLMVALKINRLHSKQWSEGINQMLLARCYLQSGDLTHAAELLHTAERLARSLSAQHLLLNVLESRITLNERLGEHDEARQLQEQARQLRKELLAPQRDDELCTMELRFEST